MNAPQNVIVYAVACPGEDLSVLLRAASTLGRVVAVEYDAEVNLPLTWRPGWMAIVRRAVAGDVATIASTVGAGLANEGPEVWLSLAPPVERVVFPLAGAEIALHPLVAGVPIRPSAILGALSEAETGPDARSKLMVFLNALLKTRPRTRETHIVAASVRAALQEGGISKEPPMPVLVRLVRRLAVAYADDLAGARDLTARTAGKLMAAGGRR
ncbi:hypothetical protein [Streptomyces sp. NPDC088925]|uniref:hypothetical protein n=1 Tax=Streptomyces sp. NPDC088925 TaxID=3365914 RepID=UPI0038170281